jgi:hypothetical protein
MTSDEFEWVLQSFSRRAPFQPFVIEFMNGKRITVRHPEAVAYWRNLAMFRNQQGLFQLFGPDAVCRVCDLEMDENRQ